MRIAIIADTYLPLRTSGAVQLRDLAQELVRQGHAGDGVGAIHGNRPAVGAGDAERGSGAAAEGIPDQGYRAGATDDQRGAAVVRHVARVAQEPVAG